LDYPVLCLDTRYFRSEHDNGVAEVAQAQFVTVVERQRMGFECKGASERAFRRHIDEHRQISYCENERPVHYEDAVMEEDNVVGYRRDSCCLCGVSDLVGLVDLAGLDAQSVGMGDVLEEIRYYETNLSRRWLLLGHRALF